MSILKKIVAEILVFVISFIISLIGVSFFNVNLKPDSSLVQSSLIVISIWIIILMAAQPAIWQKGYLTKLDRFYSLTIASIIGIVVYLFLENFAAYIFINKKSILGLQLGYLSNYVAPICAVLFCYLSLKRTSKRNEAEKKAEDAISKNRIISNCPSCGLEYANVDYREDAEAWFCSQCKAMLPKI